MPVFVSDAKLGAEKRKVVETALKILAELVKARLFLYDEAR